MREYQIQFMSKLMLITAIDADDAIAKARKQIEEDPVSNLDVSFCVKV